MLLYKYLPLRVLPSWANKVSQEKCFQWRRNCGLSVTFVFCASEIVNGMSSVATFFRVATSQCGKKKKIPMKLSLLLLQRNPFSFIYSELGQVFCSCVSVSHSSITDCASVYFFVTAARTHAWQYAWQYSWQWTWHDVPQQIQSLFMSLTSERRVIWDR